MEKLARGERQQAARSFDTGGFLNVSGSVVGDYGKTSVDMVCPNCSKTVAMKVTAANLICPECGHKVNQWRQAAQTVTLSERDVARVLEAVAAVNKRREFAYQHDPVLLRPKVTPEGWPVPSRKLMEEIKKLL